MNRMAVTLLNFSCLLFCLQFSQDVERQNKLPLLRLLRVKKQLLKLRNE